MAPPPRGRSRKRRCSATRRSARAGSASRALPLSTCWSSLPSCARPPSACRPCAASRRRSAGRRPRGSKTWRWPCPRWPPRSSASLPPKRTRAPSPSPRSWAGPAGPGRRPCSPRSAARAPPARRAQPSRSGAASRNGRSARPRAPPATSRSRRRRRGFASPSCCAGTRSRASSSAITPPKRPVRSRPGPRRMLPTWCSPRPAPASARRSATSRPRASGRRRTAARSGSRRSPRTCSARSTRSSTRSIRSRPSKPSGPWCARAGRTISACSISRKRSAAPPWMRARRSRSGSSCAGPTRVATATWWAAISPPGSPT